MHFDASAVVIDDTVAMALLADLQVRRAIARGDFDDLPGAGKPLDLADHHDPDWWINNLMRREGIVMLPASIQLRKDDAALDARLDGLTRESEVRREIDAFNERVIHARYSLPAGPPLITMPRDPDITVTAWAERRAARAADAVRAAAWQEDRVDRPRRPRWRFGRRGRH